MGSDVNVRLTGNNYSAWINRNGQANGSPAADASKTMTKQMAADTLKLFSRTICDAKVLDGNVIIDGDRLVRVSYGSYHGIFAAKNKDRTATEDENKNVRDLLRTALTTYVDSLGENDKEVKSQLERLVFTQLGEKDDSKPLMRRTIQQLIGAVYEKVSAERRPELQGEWRSSSWKKVGDDDLSVMMSKGHLKTMLLEGVKFAKGQIRHPAGESVVDASSIDLRCATLDRMFNHYLELFEEGRTDGILGAFSGTVMDAQSVGKEMLRQLDGQAFYDKIRVGVDSLSKAGERTGKNASAQEGAKAGGSFGAECLGKATHSLVKGKNRIRSLEERNMITFTGKVKNPSLPPWMGKVPGNTLRERGFIADLILSTDNEKALSFGTDGGRIVAMLVDNADLFASICREVTKDGDGSEKKAVHGSGDERGKLLLDALAKTMPSFKDALVNCIKELFNPKGKLLKLDDCKDEFLLRDVLFAKMDKVVAHFAKFDLEAKISAGVDDFVDRRVDVAVNMIKNVCDCNKKEVELSILKQLAVESCDYDKRRLAATAIRECVGNDLICGDASSGNDIPGFIHGMGVYANKILQGLKLKSDISDLGCEREVYEAVKASRSSLPPIDTNMVAAQIEKSFALGDPHAEIKRIDVKSSCGSGSVAQTFLCDITVNRGGEDVKKSVIVKVLRPEIRDEFNRQANIVQGYIDKYTGKDKTALLSQHSARMRDFREELVTRDELINALIGARSLGQSLGLKDGDVDKKVFTWNRLDGKKFSVEEKNYIGSESLILNSLGESNRKEVVDAINNAKTRKEISNILDKYFIVGAGECMLIECAEGKNLASYQREIDDQIKNRFGVKSFEQFKNETPDKLANKPDDEIKKAYYDDVVQKYMEPRRELEKLNRSLLQLKCSLIDGVLNKKDADKDAPELAHFTQADLHSDNMIFNRKTGALTIIDYGRTITLSDGEADALRGLIKLECQPDGAENGKVMADIFRTLLESEYQLCEGIEKKLKDANARGSEEYAQNAKRLAELTAAKSLIGEGGALAGDVLSREFARAYRSIRSSVVGAGGNNKGRMSMLEAFQRVLVNVEGFDLPIPFAVTTFIDSYSRLDNALADVQKSIKDVDGALSKLMDEYENEFVEARINDVTGFSFNNCGWFDASTNEDGTTVVKAMVNNNGKSAAKTFDAKFNTLWSWRTLPVSVDANSGTELRRLSLKAMQYLIAAERKRIQDAMAALDNKGRLAGSLGVDAGKLEIDKDSVKGWNAAIEKLDEAEKAIGKELELLNQTITSDSLFEHQFIPTELLEGVLVDLNDVDLKKLPISLEERLKLNFCINNNVEKLPDDLEQKYREILVGTGQNWTELLPKIHVSHTPADFVALLSAINDNKFVDRSVANLDRAPESPAKRAFSFEGLEDDDVADKWIVACLKDRIERDKALDYALKPYLRSSEDPNAGNHLEAKAVCEAFAAIKNSNAKVGQIRLAINVIGVDANNRYYGPKDKSGLDAVLGSEGENMLMELYGTYSKNAYFRQRLNEFDFFAKLADDSYNWTKGEAVKFGDLINVSMLCAEFDALYEQPVDNDLYDKIIGLLPKEAKDAVDTVANGINHQKTKSVGDYLNALYRVSVPTGKADGDLLDRDALKLYKGMLDLLKDFPFSNDVVPADPVTVGDYRRALEALRQVAFSSVMPASITMEEFTSIGGEAKGGVITNKMAKDVFDKFIGDKKYDVRKEVGVLDDVNIGLNKSESAEVYNGLVEKANDELFKEEKNKLVKNENPTNDDVWRIGKKIHEQLDSQPHLHDDRSVIRNLFPGVEKELESTPLVKAKDSFELSVYIALIGAERKSWLQAQDLVNKVNAGFTDKLDSITRECKKLVIAEALKFKKSLDGKLVYSRNDSGYEALRKQLLPDPEAELLEFQRWFELHKNDDDKKYENAEQALPDYQKTEKFMPRKLEEIMDRPGGELALFQCMLDGNVLQSVDMKSSLEESAEKK